VDAHRWMPWILSVMPACGAVTARDDTPRPGPARTCVRTWRRITLPRPMRPRLYPSVTVIGTRVVVFGGVGSEGVLGDGWLWDGTRWTPLPTTGAPAPRMGHHATWTGRTLVIWGGESHGEVLEDGARWQPGQDHWQAVERPRNILPVPHTPTLAGVSMDTDPTPCAEVHGALPPPRRDATVVTLGRSTLWLWGEDADGLRDDAWELTW